MRRSGSIPPASATGTTAGPTGVERSHALPAVNCVVWRWKSRIDTSLATV